MRPTKKSTKKRLGYDKKRFHGRLLRLQPKERDERLMDDSSISQKPVTVKNGKRSIRQARITPLGRICPVADLAQPVAAQ